MERRFGPLVFIPGPNAGKYPHCNSLYVEADRKVLIDPASDRERLLRLRESPGVDCIWLSHWHEDHFMHWDLFADTPLWISGRDARPLSSLDSFLDAYGVHGEERRAWARTMQEVFHYEPRHVDREIQPGEILDLGGVTVEVVETPGHTPGHCALFFREHKMLFLGDYDLTSFGPWYGDIDSDIDAVIDSVERLRRIPAKVWIASHGNGIFENDPGDLWDRFLEVIRIREEKLLSFLNAPRSLAEIVEARIVYGRKREPKEFFDFGERALMKKHLERLAARKLVDFDGRVYSRS